MERLSVLGPPWVCRQPLCLGLCAAVEVEVTPTGLSCSQMRSTTALAQDSCLPACCLSPCIRCAPHAG